MLRIISLVCVSLMLIAGLSGCQILFEPQQPPETWVPLPTVGMGMTPSAPLPTDAPDATVPPTATMPAPSVASTATRADHFGDPALGASMSRDQAWDYLLEHYPDPRLSQTPEWVGPEVQGIIGASKYRYTAGLWTAVSSVPLVAPDKVVYEVSFSGPGGYHWQAQVFPDGSVVADAPEVGATPEPVEGLEGTLHVLPDTSPFDDYFRQLGDEGVQYGVEGADEVVRAQLAMLGGTGTVVQIWGDLQRGVSDYGEAQLLVAKLEVVAEQPTRAPSAQPAPTEAAATQPAATKPAATPPPPTPAPTQAVATQAVPTQAVATQAVATQAATRPATAAPTAIPAPRTEIVEGWIGVVRTLPEGSAYNDFFDGQQPARQVGIAGAMARTEEDLRAAAASGTPVRVWGILELGANDYGEGRLVVSHIEPL